MSITKRITLAAGLVVAACSTSSETRVHLEITAADALAIDSYQLRVGTRTALATPLPALELILPDEMAGHDSTLQIWGLAGGQQVAFGMATVTPVLQSTVTVPVALNAVSCGTWCTEGAVECSSDGTSTCEMQSNGCFAWSATVPCPTQAPACTNGVCAATCSDECAAGQTECDSTAAVRICGQYDHDTCLDWSAPMGCSGGGTCENGVCGNAADPCDNVVCDHPPSGCFAANGTCANGSCTYPFADGGACNSGDACTTGVCMSGVCSGTPKVCDMPPPSECIGMHTQRDFALPATCTSGTCSYSFADTACDPDTEICQNSACCGLDSSETGDFLEVCDTDADCCHHDCKFNLVVSQKVCGG